ncbi:hypothetical protein HAX54_013275 [Datura stramonium]|uniref:Uncharacterized protein n=1 Tax=Datura stramonium TaxID=4076 RepID=A0ABS8TN21_DATST|nr:hypothetical protein [Datura stramonium]
MIRDLPICRIWCPVSSEQSGIAIGGSPIDDPLQHNEQLRSASVPLVSSGGAPILISNFMLFAQFYASSAQVKYRKDQEKRMAKKRASSSASRSKAPVGRSAGLDAVIRLLNVLDALVGNNGGLSVPQTTHTLKHKSS